jgi:hypothetical protein
MYSKPANNFFNPQIAVTPKLYCEPHRTLNTAQNRRMDLKSAKPMRTPVSNSMNLKTGELMKSTENKTDGIV